MYLQTRQPHVCLGATASRVLSISCFLGLLCLPTAALWNETCKINKHVMPTS